MDLLLETDNFPAWELSCHCGCEYTGMDRTFLSMLQEVREDLGFPLPISSAARCPEHNAAVSSTGEDGPHTTLRAVDILLFGGRLVEFNALVSNYVLGERGQAHRFTGLGFKQNGPRSQRFIHLDNLLVHETRGPRPWVWTY
jgi:hypothetical protein